MKSEYANHPQNDDLFRSRLDQMINLCHELVLLTDRVDWAHLDEQLAPLFVAKGRPSIPSLIDDGNRGRTTVSNGGGSSSDLID